MVRLKHVIVVLAATVPLLASNLTALADNTTTQPVPRCGRLHWCPPPPTPPNATQPTCKGPHKGPNGVMIQCD